ncbi:hypothetical protein PVAP13_8KG042300 [Panicum virgatum]|uniref:Uncharacterized protein n=1 Tax=Panicum virgatum TaxID=38727 RepID=A0A8T0PHZ1_PANVG|nr:hypothetical protein PVAP13_8KG042300 [Panicum virgatum]
MLNLGLSTAQMLPDQATAPLDAACNDDPVAEEAPAGTTVEDLFATPTTAAILSKPQHPQRPRRTFDMTSVHRSARLAKKPALPAVQRAQRNLIRKLGLPADELRPIEELLQEFISMFTGPLPEQIVAAMTAIFDLDDEEADSVNEALLQYAGDAVEDLQGEVAAGLA